MSLEILHQDEWLLAVNKPAGLAVIPEGWDAQAPHLRGLLEAEYGPVWVVHRLDKTTSGLILFARDAETHRALNALFEQRQVEKTYHALLAPPPDWETRTARHPLRANVGRKHRTVPDRKRGKAAVTAFRVLRRFRAAALVEARPHTGRTHQIRAHAAALGVPILGDERYGAAPTPLINRPALHAFQLMLRHPASGALLRLEAPYPADFAQALAALD